VGTALEGLTSYARVQAAFAAADVACSTDRSDCDGTGDCRGPGAPYMDQRNPAGVVCQYSRRPSGVSQAGCADVPTSAGHRRLCPCQFTRAPTGAPTAAPTAAPTVGPEVLTHAQVSGLVGSAAGQYDAAFRARVRSPLAYHPIHYEQRASDSDSDSNSGSSNSNSSTAGGRLVALVALEGGGGGGAGRWESGGRRGGQRRQRQRRNWRVPAARRGPERERGAGRVRACR
jgi:hypothetical protein